MNPERSTCSAHLKIAGLASILMLSLPAPAQRGGPPGARTELKLVARFDTDQNGHLDRAERLQAREWLRQNATEQERGPGRRGPWGRGPGGRGLPEETEGQRDAAQLPPVQVAKDEVEAFPQAHLYDPQVVRTFFLEFEHHDWSEELAAFYRSDVEVPATLTVDGEVLESVGVGYRGNSSYFTVQGKKKSFAISVDARNGDQRLHGYKTLNLLNAHSDPSFIRELIHAQVARRISPALQANLVHLVVNGESYGVYVNVQQFNKDFLDDEFGTRKGIRWKVPANFRGAGLRYTGEERAPYESAYQLKTSAKDQDAALEDLIGLCRVLTRTPADQLMTEVPKVLDVDAALRFLAIDTVLLDADGYSSRGSDFVIWQGPDGRFRPLPYDSNEVLGAGGGRGPGGGPGGGMGGPPPGFGPPPGEQGDRPGPRGNRRGGPGGHSGPDTSPLALLTQLDERPLARLLTVPKWRARFLSHVRTLARDGLDWSTLGPFCSAAHASIDPLVKQDDKALYGYEAFQQSLEALRITAEARRKALLQHESIAGPWPAPGTLLTTVRPQGDARRVAAELAAGDGIHTATLYVSKRRRGPFTAIPMAREGDVWIASTDGFDEDEVVWVFVEVGGEGDRVAWSPAGGSGRPQRVALGAD